MPNITNSKRRDGGSAGHHANNRISHRNTSEQRREQSEDERRGVTKPSDRIYKRPYSFVLKEVDPNADLKPSPVAITLTSNQRYAKVHLHSQWIKPINYPQSGGY